LVTITELLPDEAAKVTVWPAMGAGSVPWSRTVTVMIDDVDPSAGTSFGDATTVELLADAAGAAKATVADWMIVTDPLVAW
jgi:hypothetical protein